MENKLKLLFLWVKKYKNIHYQGFIFSNEYNFNVVCSKGKLVLKIDKNRNFQKNILFYENFNISAITGLNGCGKSAVLESLCSDNISKLSVFTDITTQELYCYCDFEVVLPDSIKKIRHHPKFILVNQYDIQNFRRKNNLSSGEIIHKNFSEFINNRLNKGNYNICIDEIEQPLHPELQRDLVLNLILCMNQNIKNNVAFNIIWVTKSPIIISDFCSKNILFINEKKDIYCQDYCDKDLYEPANTFAGNIYDIYTDALSVKRPYGKLGEYIIKDIINYLKYQKNTLLNMGGIGFINKTNGYSSNIIDISSNLESYINLIGDSLFRNLLCDEYNRINKYAKNK